MINAKLASHLHHAGTRCRLLCIVLEVDDLGHARKGALIVHRFLGSIDSGRRGSRQAKQLSGDVGPGLPVGGHLGLRIRDGCQPFLLALHRGGGQISITLEPQLLGAERLGIDPSLVQVVGQRAEAAALAAQSIGQSFGFARGALLRLFGLFDLLACTGIGRFQLGDFASRCGNGLLLCRSRRTDKALHLLQLALCRLQLLLVAFLLFGQVLDGGGGLAGFLLCASQRPFGAIHLLAQ